MNDSENKNILSDPKSWVDDYSDYLFGFALTRVREKRLAEDLVQETFLAALKAHHSFAGQSSEKTWLVGILKNKIIDHFRKSRREVSSDEIESLQSSVHSDFETAGNRAGQWLIAKRPADWVVDPSDPAERAEFWKYLQYCLGQAPKHIADVFALREIDGLENKEICNKLEISSTNLRVILHRARQLLRRCLEVNWLN